MRKIWTYISVSVSVIGQMSCKISVYGYRQKIQYRASLARTLVPKPSIKIGSRRKRLAWLCPNFKITVSHTSSARKVKITHQITFFNTFFWLKDSQEDCLCAASILPQWGCQDEYYCAWTTKTNPKPALPTSVRDPVLEEGHAEALSRSTMFVKKSF